MPIDDLRLPEQPPAGYQQRRSFHRKLLFDATLDVQLVDRIWENPAHVVSGGIALQTKERCQVARIPFRDREFLFKHHNWGGTWKALGKSRKIPKARRAFFQALALQQAGIRTPRPLALVESTFGRLGLTSSLLTEYVPGTPLYHLIRAGHLPPEHVDSLTDQITVLCQRLATLCCAHNDLKPENLIVDDANQIWLIDLENTRIYPDRETLSYWFGKDLERLLRRRTWRFHPSGESLLRQKLLRVEEVMQVRSCRQSLESLQPSTPSVAEAQPAVAALILCEAPAAALELCMASVQDVVDEIVVIAADGTPLPPSFSNRDNCQIVQIPGTSTTEYVAEAIGRTRAPWILTLRDQDQLSPDLALEIQILLESEPPLPGYQVRCRRRILNRIAKFGTTRGEQSVRLFRREAFRLMRNQLQLTAEVMGPVGHLNSRIMVSDGGTFRECLRRIERRVTTAERACGGEATLLRQGRSVVRAGIAFWNDYVRKFGLLDGRIGLRYGLLRAWECYLQGAAAAVKLESSQQRSRRPGAEHSTIPISEAKVDSRHKSFLEAANAGQPTATRSACPTLETRSPAA